MRNKRRLIRAAGVRQTLRKSEILRGDKRFYELYAEGKNIPGKFLECFYITRSAVTLSGSSMTVGFTISKKIRGSVIRNHIKRGMREAFRRLKPQMAENLFNKQSLVEIVFAWTQPVQRSSTSIHEGIYQEMQSMMVKVTESSSV